MEISREQMRAIENIHSDVSRKMAEHYAKHVGSAVNVDIAFVDITTYAEFIMSLPEGTCSFKYTIEAMGGPAACSYRPDLANSLVACALGSKADGPLTADEQAAMGKIVAQDLSAVEAAWKSVEEIRISGAELETDPEGMKVVEPRETVILVAHKVDGPDFSGLVNFIYPDSTLEAVLPKLG